MSILLRRTSALLVLLALLLCIPQGSLMLCAAEDGHVALEAACGVAVAGAHAASPGAPADADCDCIGGCGPCRDAQVGTELSPGRVREDLTAANAPALAALLPATLPAALRAAAPAFARRPAAPPPPPARVAAGVQLRI